MIKINTPSDCTGCSACKAVCGLGAISLEEDNHGFVFPVVNTETCVNCGRCVKTCPMINDIRDSRETEFAQQYYGAYLTTSEIAKSQSGGAFKAIADAAIDMGCWVYGAHMDENFNVYHKGVDNKEDLDSLRGSKYVQSDMNNVFREIGEKLKNGESVLFSGVGCQVAGLLAYCKNARINTQKLITVDIVCHGVPNQRNFREYLAFIEKKYNSKVINYKFRDKARKGWNSAQSSIMLSDGRTILPESGFYRSLFLRHSCHDCHYTNFNRPGDITIGDFWGIEKIRPELAKLNQGVSLIITNTPKGENILGHTSDIEYFKVTKEDLLQPQLQAPTPVSRKKKIWEYLYRQKGFDKAVNIMGLWGKQSLFNRIYCKFISTVILK